MLWLILIGVAAVLFATIPLVIGRLVSWLYSKATGQ